MIDIMNDKMGHNIVNDKIAALFIGQMAYLVLRWLDEFCESDLL